MTRPLSEKLTWRLQFLLGGTPTVAQKLLGANPFGLRERLAFVNPLAQTPSREDLILRSLRRRGGTDDYFAIDGLRVFFRPDFPIADEKVFLDGVVLVLKEAYLHRDMFSSRVRINPGDTVLDLGGNIGTSAMTFARLTGPHGKVYSFEPLIPTVIERNARENGFANITVMPVGVADRGGKAEMDYGDEVVNASVARKPGKATAKKMVPLVALDDFVAEQGLDRVDFIKMDIEGAEELALRGAARTVERFRPRWSIASYHTDFVGDPQHPKLVALLDEYGYRIEEVDRQRIFAW